MGDRTWGRFQIKKSDYQDFIASGALEDGIDADEDPDIYHANSSSKIYTFNLEEINYGGDYIIEKILKSKKPLTCLLYYGEGSGYGPGIHMVFFGRHRDIGTTREHDFYVKLDADGNIDQKELESERYNARFFKLIDAYFNDQDDIYVPALASMKFGHTPVINLSSQTP